MPFLVKGAPLVGRGWLPRKRVRGFQTFFGISLSDVGACFLVNRLPLVRVEREVVGAAEEVRVGEPGRIKQTAQAVLTQGRAVRDEGVVAWHQDC